jgi:Domain of unknown function (DUF4386)
MAEETSPVAELDHRVVFAVFALLSGVLTLAVLVALALPVPPDPGAQILFAAGHRGLLALEAVVMLAWAVCSVPFLVATGRLLRPAGPAVALAATILSAVGVLLLGYATRTYIGAVLSILAAASDVRGTGVVQEAAVWRNLSFFLTDPGLMTLGLGQFLFGWLARQSRVLPRWLSWVGMLGGLAGLLTDAVYQTGALAVAQLLSFAAWAFVIGWMLLRAGSVAARRVAPPA